MTNENKYKVGDRVKFSKLFVNRNPSLVKDVEAIGTIKEIQTFGPVTLALVDGLGLTAGIQLKYLELVKEAQ